MVDRRINEEIAKSQRPALDHLEELELEQKVDRAVAARIALGAERELTATEQAELESIAASLGFRDGEDMVTCINTVFGEEDPWRARMGILVASKESRQMLERVAARNNVTIDAELVDEAFAMMRNGTDARREPWTRPSCAGLPPNEEIASYHAECAAKTRGTTGWAPLPFAKDSPYGPMASGASLDELSDATLDGLLRSSAAQCVGYKLKLTVVGSTFLAGAVTTLVADGTGQYVRLAIYNTNITSSAQATALLPLGAHFHLKQPFLKRCEDLWLGLRVDDPATLVRLDIPLSGRVLVLGDGDFSFSRALATQNSRNGTVKAAGTHITATSLDSKKEVEAKYRGAKSNLEALMQVQRGVHVKVCHGIDATNLSVLVHSGAGKRKVKVKRFDTIVWNFPYPPAIGTSDSTAGAALMRDFFASVGEVVKDRGEVRIVLATKQGGSSREAAATRRAWDIDAIAADAGFELIEVFPFEPTLYDGYTPKREYKDDSFPYQNARVHVFRYPQGARSPQSNVTASAERHLEARMASMIHSVPAQRANGQSPSSARQKGTPAPHDLTVAALERYANTSATARRLLDAAELFAVAKEMMDFYTSRGAFPDLPGAFGLTMLLNGSFSVRDGELTVEMSIQSLQLAVLSAKAAIVVILAGSVAPLSEVLEALHEDDITSDIIADDHTFFGFLDTCREMQLAADGRMADGVWIAPYMTREQAGDLASALHVLASLLMLLGAFDVEVMPLTHYVLDCAIGMGLRDTRLHALRANVHAYAFNHVSEDDAALGHTILEAVLADAQAVLDTQPNDPGALFSKSFALRSDVHGEDSASDAKRAKEAIQTYQRYLEVVESDDRHRATVHYHIGMLHLFVAGAQRDHLQDPAAANEARALAVAQYQRGLEAETERLPLFRPTGPVTSKEMLSILSAAPKSGATPAPVAAGKRKRSRSSPKTGAGKAKATRKRRKKR